MKSKIWLISMVLIAALLLVFGGQSVSAYFNDGESSIDNILRIKFPFLLSADNFSVLAGSTITNTGITTVTGDLGLSPGTDLVGFPPGTIIGTQYINDAVAAQAQTDLTTAYNNAASQGPGSVINGNTLGDLDLEPGVYSGGALSLTGTLTLTGDADDVWIIIAASTLDTAAGSQVILGGTAKADNVYWVVGSSATLGLSSSFKGNIMALASITLNAGVVLEGRVLARTAAVTLNTNIITIPAP
jgi:hypothetical protein